MQKAYVYARYSTDMQREESIEAQIAAINEYAQQKGITIARQYIDRASSGKTAEGRENFLQMIADAKSGEVSLILVHKSNRFARNREESAIYKHKLRKLGITVKAVAQDFGEGPHAVLMDAIMEGLDEYYSLELATETMKTLKVNASKCQYNGGRPLYGYRINSEKHYELEPQEAAVVKDIYTKIVSGWSYIEVLRYLDEAGVCNRQGKSFGKNSLHDMLRNERYTGTYIFNETPRRHPVTGKRTSRIKKNSNEIIKIPGGIPQIVQHETWEKVQIIMDARKQNPTTARKRKYLLTGFIKCGVCGGSYIGITTTTQYTEKSYYRCSSKGNKPGSCNSKNISLEETETKVEEFLRTQIESIIPEELAAATNKFIANERGNSKAKIAAIKNDLWDIEKKIENLLVALENGDTSEVIRSRLAGHVEIKEKLQDQLEILATPQRVVTPGMITRQLNTLNLDGKTQEEKRAVLSKFGLKITINPDKSITYSFGEDSLTNYGVGEGTRQLVKLFTGLLQN